MEQPANDSGQLNSSMKTIAWSLTGDLKDFNWPASLITLLGRDDTGELEELESLSKILNADDAERVIQAIRETSISGKASLITASTLFEEGPSHLEFFTWAENTGPALPSVVLGTIKDVSNLFEYSAKVERYEQLLEDTQALANLYYWQYDVRTGDVFQSGHVYKMLEVGSDYDLNDDTFDPFIHPDDYADFVAMRSKISTEEAPAEGHDFRLVVNGKLKYMHMFWLPVKNSLGEIIKVAGVTQEVTEAKKAEAEYGQLKQQLYRSQKMEAIGLLAGGIAHDFNNILSSILGYADLADMLDIDDDDGNLAYYLTQIRHGGERSQELISSMLTFARSTVSVTSTQLLQPIVENTLKLLLPSLPSSIDIQISIPDDGSPVILDPLQFEQVLMNLCINARDAMEDEGKITIAVEEREFNKVYCDSCHEEISGSFVVLSVEDSGPGIPENVLGRVFDPFYSSKEVGKGTGMGLSIVHGLIHSIEGHIRVLSGEKNGARFEILIPISLKQVILPQKELKDSSESIRDKSDKDKTIIIIDDEEMILDVMKKLLRQYGYRVITFIDSNDAWTHFRQSYRDIDLVITDRTMPGLTGIDLIRQIHNIDADFPIILSTGYSERSTAELERDLMVQKVLKKPVKLEKLLDEIEILIPASPL